MLKSGKSIRSRLMRITVGILAVSTVVVTVITSRTESRKLHGFLRHRGESMASYIAKLSQDPLITSDFIRLDNFVNEANKDEDIVYAVIHDMNGNILTSHFASLNFRAEMLKQILAGLPRESELPDIIAAIDKNGDKRGDLIELFAIMLGTEHLMKISSPIMSGDKLIGTVAIGMSEHKAHNYVVGTVYSLLAVNLFAAFALGTVLFIASSKVVFEPISALVRTTLLLAKGDLTARVTGPSTGEIRMLVDSFNSMAEALDKRTNELVETRDELVRNEKMAMLGLIAANMGNELRNPLGVMNNAVFYLKNVVPETDETVREYLDIIKSEIDNSQKIIADLVDFARDKKPVCKRIEAYDLVAQAINSCVIPKNVTVQHEIAENLPPLMVDPGQIEQVLSNLLSNALEAMPDGGFLRISALDVEPDENFLKICIADTGEGILPENMDKLFSPLFSTRSRGIGLGLALCAKLVETNGGRIEVESRIGEGTAFTVILPVAREV